MNNGMNVRSFANQKQPYTNTTGSPSKNKLDHENYLRPINLDRKYDYDSIVPTTVTPADVGYDLFRSHGAHISSKSKIASPSTKFEQVDTNNTEGGRTTLSTKLETNYSYTKAMPPTIKPNLTNSISS